MITGRNDNVVKGIDKKPKDDLGRRGLLETRWKRFKIHGNVSKLTEAMYIFVSNMVILERTPAALVLLNSSQHPTIHQLTTPATL